VSFVNLLIKALSSRQDKIYLALAVRSEFLTECAGFPELTKLINSSNFLVQPLNRDTLLEVIEKTMASSGASVDPDLTMTLINDIGEHDSSLLIMQHAMMMTWNCWRELDEPEKPVNISDYESAGTAGRALAISAGKIYEDLTIGDKKVCELLFRAVTTRDNNNKPACNPLEINTIIKWTGCSYEELLNVAMKYSLPALPLLTLPAGAEDPDKTIIDLKNADLIPYWDLLGKWVDEEASSAQMYLRLSEGSALYQQGKTGLLRQPDLQLALDWMHKFDPGIKWAQRYDPAWERAMVYLRTSEKAFMAEKEAEEKLRKRKIRKAGILSAILGVVLVIVTLAMVNSFLGRKRINNNLKESEFQKNEAISRKDFAEEFASELLKRSLEADSLAAELASREKETQRQLNLTENRRIAAERIAAEAGKKEELALARSDSAVNASRIAAGGLQSMAIERDRAQQLRMIYLAKAMTIRSMQMNDRKDMQSLLAYQAYLFNRRYNGQVNDADIFGGLYNAAKQNGNVSIKNFRGHAGEIKSIAFMPGKREFFTSGIDGKVLKWDLDSQSSLQVVYSGTDIIDVLAVSPDADWLACGAQSAAIRMIPINGRGIGFELKGHTGKIRSLVFSFDSRHLYSASADGNVRKWDLSSHTSVIVSPAAIMIAAIDLSSTGRHLAGAGSNGSAVVWDPDRNEDVFTITSEGRTIKTVRFKPGENILAVGYTDGFVETWDIEKRMKMSEVKAHDGEINDIKFNGILSQMATAGNDGKLKLWDTNDLSALPVSFDDSDGMVMTVGFSNDGQIIVAGTVDGGSNLVGRPASADLIASNFCSQVERNFTQEEWNMFIGKDIKYETTCPGADTKIRIREINRR
jgi:WD40 repeat protein